MANTPKKRTKKKKTKTKKKISQKLQFVKILIGLLIVIVLVVLAALLTRHLMLKKHPIDSEVYHQPSQLAETQKPTFEIYPKKDIPSSKQKQGPVTPFTAGLPKIAIIIDDIGYDSNIVKKFISLDTPLTLSLLPQSPQKNRIMNLARAEGFDLMLHQPMEPNEYPRINPGPGTLLTTMPPDELIRRLNENLDEMPNIKGVNNHMGSKMTASSDQMRQIFSVLKKRGLFFVDSRTTAQTICKMSAQLLHVPFGERDVFIDHKHQKDFIEKQMRELARIALSHGEAIGIAHPHTSTYQVLQKLIPELKKSVAFVPVSELVRPAG
jgi:polysaccharide deacetylase 2 family uncharacterized protein YibQ